MDHFHGGPFTVIEQVAISMDAEPLGYCDGLGPVAEAELAPRHPAPAFAFGDSPATSGGLLVLPGPSEEREEMGVKR